MLKLAHKLSGDRLLACGLMSGTSMDGVDAALVELNADADDVRPVLLAFTTVTYSDEQRDLLMDLAVGQQCTAEDIATLNTAVAVAFANAFFTVCRESDIKPAEVLFIGSHGQTVAHVPPGDAERPIAGTLQLGSPGMIAALTGVTTVGDFRVGDMALGGQGAPLVPYVDYLIRRSDTVSRIILNLGGIANITYLPKGGKREDTLAFDTGPGNMVLDSLYRALFPGAGLYDMEGSRAAQGRVSEELAGEFLRHPYFSRKPPKSAGHGEFGVRFAWKFLERARQAGCSANDTLATAAMVTAVSVASAIDRYVTPAGGVDEILVSGGGVHNRHLVETIADAVKPVRVEAVDVLGIPANAKEAVDFAILARETLFERTNVLESATGASRAAILGTIALGSFS